MEEINNKK
jgi:hypothetical protein